MPMICCQNYAYTTHSYNLSLLTSRVVGTMKVESSSYTTTSPLMHVPCQVTLDLRYSMSGSPSLPVGFEGEETSPKEASPKEVSPDQTSPQSKSPFGTPRWGVLGLGHMDMHGRIWPGTFEGWFVRASHLWKRNFKWKIICTLEGNPAVCGRITTHHPSAQLSNMAMENPNFCELTRPRSRWWPKSCSSWYGKWSVNENVHIMIPYDKIRRYNYIHKFDQFVDFQYFHCKALHSGRLTFWTTEVSFGCFSFSIRGDFKVPCYTP